MKKLILLLSLGVNIAFGSNLECSSYYQDDYEFFYIETRISGEFESDLNEEVRFSSF